MPQPKDRKNQFDFQTQNFMLNLLRKKFFNKIKYSRSSPDPDFSQCNLQQPYTFFAVFVNFRTLAELWKTKIGELKAEELAANREKIFDYLKRKDF